jgi:opacity protein-like surface antigen
MKLRSLAAVALLAPAVAFAAGTSGGKSKTTSSSSSTQTSATAGTALEGLSVGGFVGYETDDLSGISLRLDGELPFRQLSPQINLSLVGSLGYSHLTWEPFSYWKLTANTFKLVPAARFTMPLNEQFSVFGDAGLGLAYISMTAKYDGYLGYGGGSYSDSSVNIMMRLGVGAWYQMNPQLRLGALLEYDPVFGDYGYSGNGVGGTQSTLLIQVGAMYRL